MKINKFLYAVLLLLPGCSFFNAQPDLSHSYIIHSAKRYDIKHLKTDTSISVEISRFPEYLMRPDIATKKTDNELNFHSLQRWILPLNELLQLAIKDSLLAKFDNISVKCFPQTFCHNCDIHLKLYVDEFIFNDSNKSIFLKGFIELLNKKYEVINKQRFSFDHMLTIDNILAEDIVKEHANVVDNLNENILNMVEYTIDNMSND